MEDNRMIKKIYLTIFTLAFLTIVGTAEAVTDKELRQQQKEALKERMALKKERSENYREAQKDFREYIKTIKKENREQVSDLKVDFDLKRTELEAEHEAQVAEAATENEKKTMNLIMNANFDQAALEQLQKDAKIYSDELFSLKKQLAEKVHLERIEFEKQKNKLYEESDQKALDKASELGMTKDFSPILAKPIGGSLTKSEERWNEREEQEVIKLKEKNHKMLTDYRNGKKLRDLEIQNLNEDFKLQWEEKSEIHNLDAESFLFNSLMIQGFQGGQINQQELINKVSEINKKKKLIKIEYKKIREKNRIKRNKTKQDILKN